MMFDFAAGQKTCALGNGIINVTLQNVRQLVETNRHEMAAANNLTIELNGFGLFGQLLSARVMDIADDIESF